MHRIREELASFLGNDYRGEIRHDEPLSSHTYLHIGGQADFFIVPADAISLKKCLAFAAERKISVLVIGGGTNILVSDDGYRGMVISLKHFNMKKTINAKQDVEDLFIEAGVSMQGLLGLCAEKGYEGIERLAGIPGTVGGAVIGNAGAFGQEVKDVVSSLITINHAGMIKKLEREEFSFSYRKANIPDNVIILSVNMQFNMNDPDRIRERIRESIEEKKKTQPVFERSAGCVFKNPEGDSAGRLIDITGFKGARVGDIEVSPVHANFFVNKGGGTASDYLQLMNIVREKVGEKTGIFLEPEIRIIDHVA